MSHSRLIVILGFIVIGLLSRMLPHPPNFTALNAVIGMSVLCLNSRFLSICIVFSILFLSDWILGFHSSLLFVYSSFALIILIGHYFKPLISSYSTSLFFLSATFSFFLITNFGVWLSSSLYPKTLEGLSLCYLAAIPFLGNQLMGDLFYGMILGSYFYLTTYSFRKAVI